MVSRVKLSRGGQFSILENLVENLSTVKLSHATWGFIYLFFVLPICDYQMLDHFIQGLFSLISTFILLIKREQDIA